MPLHVAVLSDPVSRVPMTRDPFWIGRDPASDLCLWDLRVSRRHARLALVKGEYMISSEGRHGLHVNGNRVPFIALRDRDEIALTPPDQPNPVRLRFEWDLSGATPAVGLPLAAAWLEREKGRPRGADDLLGSFALNGACSADPERGSVVLAHERATGDAAIVKTWPAVTALEPADAFLRLAGAVAGGPHPSLARVLEAGLFPAGDRVVRWLAMAAVPGRTATLRIAEGGQSPSTVVRRLRGLFGALHLLHARGVVHGNLVPGNVLLRPDGGSTIVDLGRSFLVQDASPPPPDRHPEPEYTAPEALGPDRIPSTASDVFGLAAIGYAMFTGKAPFSADGGRSPPPPLRSSVPRIPSGLSDAIGRALSAVPGERPTSEELGHALAFADVELSGRPA